MILSILGFSVCQASISTDRMNAGGIYFGQSASEVVSIYGQPVNTREETKFPGVRYIYGRNGTIFDIIFSNGIVRGVVVKGNNGIATTDGIKVGTPVSEVKRILGKPDKETANSLEYREPSNLRFINFIIRNNFVISYSTWQR